MGTKTIEVQLGRLLKSKRDENGLTQSALANRLGVTQPTITNWESGKTTPEKKYLTKIEEILGLLSSEEISSDESNEFGTWLTYERTQKNMSITELANKAGVAYQTIWYIENNKITKPTKKTIEKIEKALEKKFGTQLQSDESKVKVKGIGDFEEFNPYVEDELPKGPGIYVFYDISDRPIYVGEGQSISSRIRDHEQKFWFKKPIVSTAAFISVDDKNLRQVIEKNLIKFMKSNAVINKQNVDR